MSNRRFVVRAAAALLSLFVCAAPAFAQRPRPDRPYRGLFGGNGADPNSVQQLDLNASLSGAYDSNVLASQQSGSIDPRYQQNGAYGNASVSVDYTRKTERASWDVTGGGSYRVYPSYKRMNGGNYFGSFGVSAQPSAKTTLSATESATYSPYLALGAIPGAPSGDTGGISPINPDFPLLQEKILSLSSSASLSHQASARSTVAIDYTFGYTDYRETARHNQNWDVGGTYSYLLSRRTTMRLGYHYGETSYPQSLGGTQRSRSHSADFGMSHTRPLSPSRSMTLGFTAGATLYDALQPEGSPSPESVYAGRRVLVNGSAFLTRQIGRSWSGTVSYTRGLQYTPGFSSPFFSDSVTAGLSGFVSPRGRVTLAAAYSSGAVDPVGGGRNFGTYSGQAGYQLAVNRIVAVFTNYSYYHYLFDTGVTLPVGLNRGVNRHSVSVGVNLWAPLLR
mgnify:CR=1 FL=1